MAAMVDGAECCGQRGGDPAVLVEEERLPWEVRPRSRRGKYLILHELEGRPGHSMVSMLLVL
jgi:hypothetical protein